MNTTMHELLGEALAFEAEAFRCDEPVEGAGLVEWFAEWRARVQAAVGEDALSGGGTDIDSSPSGAVPICSACGSENVYADAAARWNREARQWEVVNVFDKGHSCDDCQGGDARLDWREEDEEKRAGFLK